MKLHLTLNIEPNDELYRVAQEALWDWTSKQTDHNDLWEKTDESSKVVVDAILNFINNND